MKATERTLPKSSSGMLFVSNPRRLHKYLKCWLICLPFLFRQISLLVTIHNTFINHSIVALRMRTLPQYPPDRLPVDEDKIQPKLRKSWIRRKASALRRWYSAPQRQEQHRQERVPLGPSSLPLDVVDPNRESNRQERERMAGGKGKVKAMDIGSERERTLSKSSPGMLFVSNPRRLHKYSKH